MKKFVSIRTKFFTTVIILITVVTLLGSGISFLISNSLMMRQMDTQIEQGIDSVELYLSAILEGAQRGIKSAKDAIITGEIKQEDIMIHLSSIGKAIPNASAFYLGTEEGEFHLYSALGDSASEGYDPRTRPWYQGGMRKQGLIYWSEPYVDDGSGQLVITASIKVETNEFTGVIGVDILSKELNQLIKTNETETFSYLMLINLSGDIIFP